MPTGAERDIQRVLLANQQPAYNTAAVARRAGVPAATFRAWERRYGFPSPNRGASRQRLYSEQDVQAIIWLRDRIAEGLTVSTAVALLRTRLSQSAAPRPAPRSYGLDALATASAVPMKTLADRLEQALLAFDDTQATLILSEAFGLYSLEQVCLDVIQVALHHIGECWQAGTVSVAQEHFASNYIRQRLSALLDVTNPRHRDRLAVAACAPGEWHELGLLMVALFLARRGWHVLYLGPSLPTGELDRSLRQIQPNAVVLSASAEDTARGLAELVRRLVELPGPRPLIGFGGQAFERNPGLGERVPGVYLGSNAADAADSLSQAVASGSA